MRHLIRIALALALIALVAGCGGPRKRINPPAASVQELAVLPSGQWRLVLRLQNFSSVPMQFDRLQARLQVGGQDAGQLTLAPALNVGPEAADITTTTITPSLAGKVAVASALAAGQALPYQLSGTITSHEPAREDEFHYQSALNPAPGLTGVLR